jgi:hypothetical protein
MDVSVEIGGVTYPLRWEVLPAHEFDTLHPSLGGTNVAWDRSAFDMEAFFALWGMSLRCRNGSPKIKDAEALALLQTYLDEGHRIPDARELIGRAGVAGGFLSIEKAPVEAEVADLPEAAGETGTTAA